MLLSTDKEFKKFFEVFFPKLVRFCGRYIEDSEKSRDVAQEVFIRLYEKRAVFDTVLKAKAYLYEAAKNLCLDLLKHRLVEQKFICSKRAEDANRLDREVIREEAFSLLHEAIIKLPQQSRKIIELCLQGYSNQKIAEVLGIAETTVKTLRRNAYGKLREMLPRDIFILFLYISPQY